MRRTERAASAPQPLAGRPRAVKGIRLRPPRQVMAASAFLAILLTAAPCDVATGQRKDPGPPIPRRLVGYCEGENCGFDYKLVACRPLILRAADRRSSRAVATLLPGDTAVVVTGNIRVTAPGLVLLVRDTLLATDDEYPRLDTLRLVRGDTVYVLEYHELGHWTLWFRGRLTEGIEFWNGPGQNYFGRGRDSLAAFSPRKPTTETWLRLRGSDSTAGWWLREEDATSRPDWDTRCEVNRRP